MNENMTTQGSAMTANAAATKSEITSLKLISNKCHLGPRHEGLKAKTNLSSATGKLLFNNDMKIVVTGSGDKDASASSKSNESTTINLPVGGEIKQSAFYMLAWDSLYSIGTDAYKEKFEALQRARTAAYEDLGINPQDSNRPELTAQQRALYNEKVRPYSFTYFEYRLSFKQPGKKAVRSKTYRSLQRMGSETMLKHIHAKAVALFSTLEIKSRERK